MNRTKMNIKMDLMRAARSALEIEKPFDKKTSDMFINKAKEEFAKINDIDRKLEEQLDSLHTQMAGLDSNPTSRKQWGEKILTVASRLSVN